MGELVLRIVLSTSSVGPISLARCATVSKVCNEVAALELRKLYFRYWFVDEAGRMLTNVLTGATGAIARVPSSSDQQARVLLSFRGLILTRGAEDGQLRIGHPFQQHGWIELPRPPIASKQDPVHSSQQLFAAFDAENCELLLADDKGASIGFSLVFWDWTSVTGIDGRGVPWYSELKQVVGAYGTYFGVFQYGERFSLHEYCSRSFWCKVEGSNRDVPIHLCYHQETLLLYTRDEGFLELVGQRGHERLEPVTWLPEPHTGGQRPEAVHGNDELLVWGDYSSDVVMVYSARDGLFMRVNHSIRGFCYISCQESAMFLAEMEIQQNQ